MYELYLSDPDYLAKHLIVAMQSLFGCIGATSIETDSASIVVERKHLICAFQIRAKQCGIRVSDRKIAQKAGWRTRTNVVWWKSNDPRSKPSHDRTIRKLLAQDPTSIWPPTPPE